jgi:hypothetical protein
LKNKKKLLLVLIIFLSGLWINACSEDPVTGNNEQTVLLFDSPGLVDSAVVNGCYQQLNMFDVNDINLSGFSKLKVEFDGYTNSDGSFIELLYDKPDLENNSFYRKDDMLNVNMKHSVVIDKPSDNIDLEVRIYICPPVCGANEFKYTRTRDLRIYGIK